MGGVVLRDNLPPITLRRDLFEDLTAALGLEDVPAQRLLKSLKARAYPPPRPVAPLFEHDARELPTTIPLNMYPSTLSIYHIPYALTVKPLYLTHAPLCGP